MMKRFIVIGSIAAVFALAVAINVSGAGNSPVAPLGLGTTSAVQQPEDEDDQGPGKGALKHVSAIAAEFGVSEDEVLQLRNDGLGFGALFKVYQLARVKGVSASSLVASFPQVNGKPDPDFGAQFAGLTDDQRAKLKDGPKNLGKLISGQAKKR